MPVISTNIINILETDMKIYPNPFSDILHIADAEGYTLRVMTQNGVMVHTQRITSPVEALHLQHLSAGIYVLHLEKDGQIRTIKVVKQ